MPIAIDSGPGRAARLMTLLQLCDSALPVGTFTFSGGLETAVAVGAVRDVATLEGYVRALVRQSTLTDSLVALHAHRAAMRQAPTDVVEADRYLLAAKAGAEARLMAQRMGAKLVDLCRRFVRSEVLSHWGDEVRAGRAPGCYAVGQAVLFAAAGLDEKALFCALRYGQLCQLLSAALRLMRVSHFETQQLLARFAAEVDEDYTALLPLELDDVATFAPMLEVRAAQHEVGTARLFSN